MEIQEKPVLFSEEHYGPYGIGVITLNRSRALNALNSAMYDLIEPKLLAWEKDPRIAAVWIEGAGGKAFCAGGDVKQLILNIKENGISAAEDFFTKEYFVDGLTQTYAKPIIAICQGVTMGGGIGIIAGSHFRIAMASSVFAMPEVAIGLFPDVGATHFLSQLRDGFGLFLGLSGQRIHADDAVACGLMDYKIEEKSLRKIRVDVLRLPWQADRSANHQILMRYFGAIALEIKPRLFSDFANALGRKFLRGNLKEVDEHFEHLVKHNSVFQESYERYQAGSTLSRAVFHQAFLRHERLDIIETLCREWDMALRFSSHAEFAEGVRAVLIDKDQKPNWQYTDLNEVPVDNFFKPMPRNLLREKFGKYSRQILQWS